MVTAIVLFTRDLRVHDNPALARACREFDVVVPLFVVDDRILRNRYASPNRAAFLRDCLTDLRASLRSRSGDLVIRRGDPVDEVMHMASAVAASRVLLSADVSRYAQRRQSRLAAACAAAGTVLDVTPGVTVVPAGELTPAGGDHYRIFTPYWRAWSAARWRNPEQPPARVRLPRRLAAGRLPARSDLTPGPTSPRLPEGGEAAGRRVLDAARARAPDVDDLAADGTTRLSPYLHFGCVSPLVAARELREPAPGVVRQLAWRDFHHQVTAAFPRITREDYRPRGGSWSYDDAAAHAWKEGRTGVPLVDAGMRQLLVEGWMPNRVRLVAASFLTRTLRLDWRLGADHFFRWLVDGDIANNSGNWQWVAGTGNDTRPNRVFNPVRQARRYDPSGDYVRRHVPELAGVPGAAVHEPWRLPADVREGLDYPPPLR